MDRLHRRDFLCAAGVAAASGVLGCSSAAEAEEETGKRKKAEKASVEEKIVAGGPNDFMISRHLRLSGSQRAIGKALAEIAKERHKTRLSPEDPIVLRARREFFKRNYPAHYERSLGAAEAYGLKLETATVDTMSLGFNMDPGIGCSTVYYPPAYTQEGHAILSRNYDFTTGTIADLVGQPSPPNLRPTTADPYILEITPDQGYASLTLCAYDLLGGCVDGMNSAGLTVALLADDESMSKYPMEPTRSAQAGLSEIEVTRFVLDTCATVDEAKAALMSVKQYYSFIPCHYIIGDRQGNSFVWEYSHAHNKEYITPGEGKPQVITNHPVHKYKTMEEMPTENYGASSYSRYRRLQEEIGKADKKRSLETIKQTNQCVMQAKDMLPANARPPRTPGRTLWHSVYDCQSKTLEVDFYLGEDKTALKGQKRSGYLRFHLK